MKTKPIAGPPKLDGYKSIAAGTVSGYAEIADIVRDERTRTTTILESSTFPVMKKLSSINTKEY